MLCGLLLSKLLHSPVGGGSFLFAILAAVASDLFLLLAHRTIYTRTNTKTETTSRRTACPIKTSDHNHNGTVWDWLAGTEDAGRNEDWLTDNNAEIVPAAVAIGVSGKLLLATSVELLLVTGRELLLVIRKEMLLVISRELLLAIGGELLTAEEVSSTNEHFYACYTLTHTHKFPPCLTHHYIVSASIMTTQLV